MCYNKKQFINEIYKEGVDMLESKTCLNLNLYRVFYYVAKEKSITKAAKKLYISQPAISKSLKKLEEEINVSLFVRNLNGVELTEAGSILYSYIEKAYKNILMGEQAINLYNSISKEAQISYYTLQ